MGNNQQKCATAPAIRVANLSKTFRIPHEKNSTLKGAALSIFKKKQFTKFKATQDISFDVAKGEFLGIIGRNGSGKSTLLKMLAGIYVPDKGKIEIDGRVSPFLELGVGFNPELTARENIYLGGALLGLTHKDVEEKFDGILKFAELEEFVDMRFKNFSSGMQVRLAFSLSIFAHAEILLMDEVLAVGDSNFQSKCLQEFNRYKREHRTVVLVSHDIGTVQRYCDRVMLLEKGEMLQVGDPKSVCDTYVKLNMDEWQKRMDDFTESLELADTVEPIKVGRVEFIKKGESTSAFLTGDDLVLRVYITVNDKAIKKFNCGASLFSDEDIYIYGTNSVLDQVDTTSYLKKGYFEISFKNIPLKNNNYYFKIGISSEDDSKIYDFLDMSEVFRVNSNSQTQGIIEMEHSWN